MTVDSVTVRAARQVLLDGVSSRVFPAAAAEVGASAGVIWRDSVGRLTFQEDAPFTTEGTIFDLASLTKVMVTTTLAMGLIAEGRLRLEDRVADAFAEWRGQDREGVTVRDLLEHASGLPARLVDPPPDNRREFEHEICTIRLEYGPRTASIYSDLGFILLGFLLTDRGGESLATQFQRFRERLAAWEPDLVRETLAFAPELPSAQKASIAPTLPLPEDVRRGRWLIGDVHDNYAAALGGAAGHAGLFGTVATAGAFGRAVLRAARGDEALPVPLSPALARQAATKSRVPGSSRALGWDTMLPTSSCGGRMSASAFGHVGFTGTSLWIDPVRDRYFILLANRACGGGTLDQMREMRRAFHDALRDV